MSTKRTWWDILGGAVVLLSLILLLNPFDILMLSMGAMMVLTLFVVAVFAFAAFVWREQAHDEREALLVGRAGRVAYLSGAGILTLGIILETLSRSLDIWLPIALGGMVLTKMAMSAYYQLYS